MVGGIPGLPPSFCLSGKEMAAGAKPSLLWVKGGTLMVLKSPFTSVPHLLLSTPSCSPLVAFQPVLFHIPITRTLGVRFQNIP